MDNSQNSLLNLPQQIYGAGSYQAQPQTATQAPLPVGQQLQSVQNAPRVQTSPEDRTKNAQAWDAALQQVSQSDLAMGALLQLGVGLANGDNFGQAAGGVGEYIQRMQAADLQKLKIKQELEQQRLSNELNTRRVDYEGQRLEADAKRAESRDALDQKRLALDEKRYGDLNERAKEDRDFRAAEAKLNREERRADRLLQYAIARNKPLSYQEAAKISADVMKAQYEADAAIYDDKEMAKRYPQGLVGEQEAYTQTLMRRSQGAQDSHLDTMLNNFFETQAGGGSRKKTPSFTETDVSSALNDIAQATTSEAQQAVNAKYAHLGPEFFASVKSRMPAAASTPVATTPTPTKTSTPVKSTSAPQSTSDYKSIEDLSSQEEIRDRFDELSAAFKNNPTLMAKDITAFNIHLNALTPEQRALYDKLTARIGK